MKKSSRRSAKLAEDVKGRKREFTTNLHELKRRRIGVSGTPVCPS
jgi:hypothetical protein